jgi:hypothetical protein
MSLSFPNVSLLGYSQDARFFDAGFQYASFRRINIAGSANDLPAVFGLTGTWSGAQGMLQTVQNNHDYQGLVLNGVDFGSGRIESISFAEGNDVKLKEYQANLLVYDSGNLFNLTGYYYSGVNLVAPALINTFSETYTFNKKLNGGYSYAHNASVQFVSGAQHLSTVQAAQQMAMSLFTGSNLGMAFYPGYTNTQGKRYVTETYDLINGTCGFQETFDFDNDNITYSATQTVSVRLDENGVTTATEQGQIRGIQNPNYQRALTALSTEMTGSYYRCSGAATNYLPSGTMLVTSPTVQGRTIDIFNNNIGYTVSFDNSPTNQQTYFWDYTQQTNLQDGVGTVNEAGTVQGRGVNTTTSFNNAQAGYVTVKAGIAGRTTTLFSSTFGSATNFLETKQESYAPVRGNVGYSYLYSNDPSLIANAGIRRKNVTVNTNASVYSYNDIDIFNLREIAQDDKQSTLGSQTVAVDMEGDKTVALSTFLSSAVTEINANKPVGIEVWIGGSSYSYSPNQNGVSAQLTWVFNRSASKSIAL